MIRLILLLVCLFVCLFVCLKKKTYILPVHWPIFKAILCDQASANHGTMRSYMKLLNPERKRKTKET